MMTLPVRKKRNPAPPSPQAGFTLIELVISMVIFAVGVVGLASSSVILERQVTMAAVDSDRSAALTTAMERIRAIEFDSLQSSSDSIGRYALDFAVTQQGLYTKEVRVITTGPGMAPPSVGAVTILPQVADTFAYQVIKP